MEESSDDPLIGTVLGGLYRVVGFIGAGGMGRVYEAVHEHLGKSFAVKVLSEGRAKKPDALERFLREARSATQIEHEHIVKVVNFDKSEDGLVFIVMELLRGESLADRIKKGPIPLDEALDLSLQTASALQAAHDAGVVHRDLKPENIFLTERNGRDFVKVLDFGISKFKTDEESEVKLTATDQIMGTPLYISPELARGISDVDHRTDIYALGVITYEMLTGTPPFSGDNQFQLLWKHGNTPPEPPSSKNPKIAIPTRVEAAILRALEKEPSARFPEMNEFANALQGGTPSSIHVTTGAVAHSRWSKRGWIAVLGIGIIAAVGIGFVATRTPAPSATPTSTPHAAAPSEDSPPSNVASPEMVQVSINSDPEGASITIDGTARGTTPVTVPLMAGAASIVRFSLKGYEAQERTIAASAGLSISAKLKKGSKPPRRKPPIKLDF